MSELIEGKVAQILSENYVILNIGSNAGVEVGMAFVVLAQGEEVKDPETGEALGRWEVPKGYIRATHVQERLCTCEGFVPGEEDESGTDPSTNVLSAAMIAAHMRPESDRVRMRVNRSDVSGMPVIRPISVGDTVRESRQPETPTKKATGEAEQASDETQPVSEPAPAPTPTPETEPQPAQKPEDKGSAS